MVKPFRKPHRFKRKKPIYRNRFLGLGFLILIFLFSIFYFLFFAPTFQVEKIIITGESKVSSQALKSLIENKLENKILFLKTKTIFLVNLNDIKRDILNNFPQIAEIEIKRAFLDSLSVVIVERRGVANWCQGEKCFLLDNKGVIFDPIRVEEDSFFSTSAKSSVNDVSNGARENQLLIKIVDKENSESSILGEKVIEKEELSKILAIESELESGLKIPIKEFLISSEDKLIVATIEGWEIYFNLQSDIQWQMTKLRAVLDEKIPSEKRKDLEYIEVRFGNFAPFKYRAAAR